MVSRAPLVILGLAAACVPPAPARPADVTPLRTWAGCYVLSAAPFPSNIGSGYQLPDSIALETSGAGTRYDKVRQYQLRAAYPPSVRRGGRSDLNWALIQEDSIEAVVWADGFVDITVRLGRHDGAIRGHAKWMNDFIQVGADESVVHPSVSAQAMSIPCPDAAQRWSSR